MTNISDCDNTPVNYYCNKLTNQQEIFVATLTHDLKNIVIAQLSSMEMLIKGNFGTLNLEQTNILNLLIESSKYMQDMILTLLDTYKYENGSIHLEKENFNLKEIVERCIQEDFSLASDKNQKITYISDNEILNADKRQIRRVISNLLNNAINYGFKNSEIKLKSYTKNKKIIFICESTSPIIAEDVKVHIFEKYVCESQKYEKIGFGLGLYLARKIVEAHQGRIYLDANGFQNKFIFEIPINSGKDYSQIIW